LKYRRGYSLVEVLTVLSITMLLISILVPALTKVRAYAKGLINIRNQREIVTTVTLFAAENDQQYPPSVALCGRPDGSWRWQDPRKICTTQPRLTMKHSSVASYLDGYVHDPKRLYCPSAPYPNSNWQEAWEAGDLWDDPDTPRATDPMFGSYCLYWNYIGHLEGSDAPFRGPTTLYGGPGQSDLLVSDYFGYDGEGNRTRYGSCEKGPRAEIVDVNGLQSSYWSYPDNGAGTGVPPELNMRLHAGYMDGHVGSYRPHETRVMDVSESADGSEPYFPFDQRHPGQFFLPERAFR